MHPSDPAQPRPGVWIGYRPLLRVKGTQAVIVRPVGPVHSFWMHWCPEISRTQPCILDDCSACSGFSPRRPVSYLACQHHCLSGDDFKWTPKILEVPHSSGVVLHELKGQCLALRRIRKAGPIRIDSVSVRAIPPDLAGFDIVQSLSYLWRLRPGQQLALVDPDQWQMVDIGLTGQSEHVVTTIPSKGMHHDPGPKPVPH